MIYDSLKRYASMHAQSHSCPTLCDRMDHRPPGSSVHGIFQAGVWEWVAIPFSTEEVCFIKVNLVTKSRATWLCQQLNDFGGGWVTKSCLALATLWTVARPLSVGFSRQEYWSGLPFPSPGDFPDPGIKPRSPARQADSLPTELRLWTIGKMVILTFQSWLEE